jgi:hypothetical protein
MLPMDDLLTASWLFVLERLQITISFHTKVLVSGSFQENMMISFLTKPVTELQCEHRVDRNEEEIHGGLLQC